MKWTASAHCIVTYSSACVAVCQQFFVKTQKVFNQKNSYLKHRWRDLGIERKTPLNIGDKGQCHDSNKSPRWHFTHSFSSLRLQLDLYFVTFSSSKYIIQADRKSEVSPSSKMYEYACTLVRIWNNASFPSVPTSTYKYPNLHSHIVSLKKKQPIISNFLLSDIGIHTWRSPRPAELTGRAVGSGEPVQSGERGGTGEGKLRQVGMDTASRAVWGAARGK